MKTFELEETDLNRCAREASSSSVLVLKNGKPLALVSNVEGLDPEQIELGCDESFWELIKQRRRQKTVPWEQAKISLGKGGAKARKRAAS